MTRSEELFTAARRHIAGGVNSPVRAFAAVGGTPRFIRSAEGAYLIDEDGNRLIDYVGSWGPMILGHAHPAVVAAVVEQAAKGLSYGAPTELENRMAERLCTHIPSLEQVRMVNSGTEATMSAVRLARGFTGRDLIVKFQGCYHGHVDGLLVQAGSGALTFGNPSSPGVPAATAAHTLTLPYNDAAAAEQAFAELGDTIAAVIVEPVAGNMNCVPPVPGFLPGLRRLCDEHQSLLIFDEVMTGFRVHPGGAQALYGVRADLITLGKIIGGGMPVGAFGGRAEIMAELAPEGPVYQAGTLSGNPLAMAAGLATLEQLERDAPYQRLVQNTAQLLDGLLEAAADSGIALTSNQVGSMFGLFFTEAPEVRRFEQVQACDAQRYARFHRSMLEQGVYFAPSAYEAGFVSAAHAEEEIETTVAAAQAIFAELADG